MANAAWAFVRPTDFINGQLSAIKAQNAEDANLIKLADDKSALEYNKILRPLQLQQQQESLAHAQAIRPIQVEQIKQAAIIETSAFNDKATTTAVIDALSIPVLPGESELETYKKKLSVAMQLGGSAQTKALAMVAEEGKRLRVAAAEKGDIQTAQDILLAMNRVTPVSLGSLPPEKQMGVLTDKQLTYAIPKPQDAAMLRHITPSGDTIMKGKLEAAQEAAGLSEAGIQKAYLNYMAEQAKTGMVAMPYQQYRDALVRTTGSAPNSVTARPTPGVSPTGVPYK